MRFLRKSLNKCFFCFIHLVHAAMKPRHHPVFQRLNYKCKRARMGKSQMAPGMTGWSRDIPSFTLSRSMVWNRLKKLPAERKGPAGPSQASCCPQQLAPFLTSNQQYQGINKYRDDLNQYSLEHCQYGMYRCRRRAWQNPNSSVLQAKPLRLTDSSLSTDTEGFNTEDLKEIVISRGQKK